MTLEPLACALSVCRLRDADHLPLDAAPCFFARTEDELSLVCPTDRVPETAEKRDDGWRAFRVQGTLDFSLVGILAKLSGVLAENGIGLFAVSTYDTDYILVRAENFDCALHALAEAGYQIVHP